MNVINKRNISQEQAHKVFRFYDVYDISEEEEAKEANYIGSIAMMNKLDIEWILIHRSDGISEALQRKPFGSFMQCIEELKKERKDA